jgi:hypothetical protein
VTHLNMVVHIFTIPGNELQPPCPSKTATSPHVLQGERSHTCGSHNMIYIVKLRGLAPYETGQLLRCCMVKVSVLTRTRSRMSTVSLRYCITCADHSGLSHELCSQARTLWSWVPIPLEAWMSMWFILCLCHSVFR